MYKIINIFNKSNAIKEWTDRHPHTHQYNFTHNVIMIMI